MLDREQVQKVAHLARLELTEAEEESFTRQLSSILDYFEQLSELDTTDIQPTTRAIETSNVTRQDVLDPSLAQEEMLTAAPDRSDRFFQVPQIMSD
ncbi:MULTISPECIES: Asp-tRNA(Asn)/Glu-tRNA(Gln) amidotransferase subunit GatC [Spirulina sp. CCY15215]|jgi:aspartyl-tRNA(Asn)/glutamyl-tRNA(Gln) amidotransferase subunit C|uniref:Asp-tRNA(Asn)/Glu-tRNA(Gln) amidotransferase subunit GatC n=1 Tax=Spirulina sp. CCY15215 TaxID=2767591 RepID=UPI0019521557|nr:Asp-tRNA(Asn)/Glu-tRNA(Gln) amidotransferase subunit GatC [Spirulina major]